MSKARHFKLNNKYNAFIGFEKNEVSLVMLTHKL